MEEITKCPNEECPTNNSNAGNFITRIANPNEKFYIKKGYYKTKWNHQPVPRYKCKYCERLFSSHTNRETHRQHKPHVNERVFELVSSGVTLRRTAKLLHIAKKTVERKFDFISKLAEVAHQKFLKQPENKTSYVQFDEMETYEHTKCKPLSISIAVRASTGHIIDAQVALMRCKGKLASVSQFKYPHWNVDNRIAVTKSVMDTVATVAKKNITVASDAKKSYPKIIKSVMPDAKVDQYVSRKSMTKNDPLFRLNHTAARIRADLSRMRRRTWACTKKWENLQKHLSIYIAWNNQYQIPFNFS